MSAAYGRFRALFSVSLSVARGEVAAVLGPNGAGKSTLARVATGLVMPSSGVVMFDGEDVTGLAAWQIARRGVTHAPEGRPVFATLEVEDNLRLTLCRQLPRREVAGALERTYARFPRLAERRRQLAGTLSGGEQRMLALARALAVPPKLLVVDELSLGLSPRIVEEVFRALGQIHEQGASLLIIEQQIARALEVAEHVIVLRKGAVVYDGRPSGIGEALAAELLPTRVEPGGPGKDA
ncbi:MAG: ABC transporter ATP-binding protein [Acidimicrobiales bacterium]